MPWLVCQALAGLAVTEGRHGLAVALLVAFHCFLRIGEMFALRPGLISLNSGFTGIVALPWTKIGQRRGAQELVTIESPEIGARLAAVMETMAIGDTLVGMTNGVFRQWFTAANDRLALSHLKFKPYSLRRGGASEYYRATGNLQGALMRGRWSGIAVGRIYITEGLSLLTQMRLANLEALREYAAHI